MTLLELLSERVLEHARAGTCEDRRCGFCRIAFALALRPEWKGLLPVGWKDDITSEDWALYVEGEDALRRSMRLAIVLEAQRLDRERTHELLSKPLTDG